MGLERPYRKFCWNWITLCWNWITLCLLRWQLVSIVIFYLSLFLRQCTQMVLD